MTRDAQIERILAAWTAALSDSRAEQRSEGLLEAYRVLGRVVLAEAMESPGEEHEDAPVGASPGPDSENPDASDGRVPERARSGVAAAIRRDELTISQALDDLRLLVPTALQELDPGEGGAPALRTGLRVSRVLDLSLLRIVHAVEAAATRAERERGESLAAFTDQLSHELENRLGAARTASQMLGPAGVDLENLDLSRVGELVESSIEAALKTVQDVRDLVMQRVDPRGRDVRTMPLPLLVRSVLDDLGPMAFEAGVEVTMADDLLDCSVDSARFRLIVYNLVGNGIKYRDLEEETPFVRVGTERPGDDEVMLRVSDNGVGIPAEDLDDIFLPRSRGGGTDDVPGSGLGLAIVREAVEQVSGRIDIESEVGVGTTFTVAFRVTEPPEAVGGD